MPSKPLKFRRTNTLNVEHDLPCWRKGYEFWGDIDPATGHVWEENSSRMHSSSDLQVLG